MAHYFDDNEKSIDLILVFENDGDIVGHERRKQFISNLQAEGLEFEMANSTLYQRFSYEDDTVYIKVHAPDVVLKHYAELYDIKLAYRDKQFLSSLENTFLTRLLKTPVTRIKGKRETIRISQELTSIERSTIIWQIMTYTKFGSGVRELGISRALEMKIFTDVFPLHDSQYDDWQLLRKHWATLGNFYKYQPLEIIERYFGSEIGIYFAWLGFYTKMLFISAVFGLISFLYGYVALSNSFNRSNIELCFHSMVLCPRCSYKKCAFQLLRDSCVTDNMQYVLNNPITMCFAVFMSFWAMLFSQFWRRYESCLKYKWSITPLSLDQEMRPNFQVKTHRTKISNVTGEEEPYVPLHVKVFKVSVSLAFTVFMITVVLVSMLTVILYRSVMEVAVYQIDVAFIQRQNVIIASGTSAFLTLLIILIMQVVYTNVAYILTEMECPRTQNEFDNSYIYKKYIFSFINYYGHLIYIAFFKGNFFTYPGDVSVGLSFKNDRCDPSGCIVPLFFQMAITMIGKQTALCGWKLIKASVKVWYYRYYFRDKFHELPPWEKDYHLNPIKYFTIGAEYEDAIIQYGFVTMFVAAFPLAPLFALINNIFVIRIGGYKFLTKYRRPIPRKIGGLGPWNNIIRIVTYISVVTNPWVMSYTGNFVDKLAYKYTVNDSLIGYVDSKFSIFNVSDFKDKNLLREILKHTKKELVHEVCYYEGLRYPPDHPKKYQLTTYFWQLFCFKLLFVVGFEHIILIFTALITFFIDDFPQNIRDKMALDVHLKKIDRIKQLQEAYYKSDAIEVLKRERSAKRRRNSSID